MTRTKRDRLLALNARLPRTWTPFFARHGNLTPVQQQAIPLILDGKNTLVMASTATGKTEAVIAPLLERYCLDPIRRPKGDSASKPSPHSLHLSHAGAGERPVRAFTGTVCGTGTVLGDEKR